MHNLQHCHGKSSRKIISAFHVIVLTILIVILVGAVMLIITTSPSQPVQSTSSVTIIIITVLIICPPGQGRLFIQLFPRDYWNTTLINENRCCCAARSLSPSDLPHDPQHNTAPSLVNTWRTAAAPRRPFPVLRCHIPLVWPFLVHSHLVLLVAHEVIMIMMVRIHFG